ncbi:MAG: TM0996/MTH895 family glutaredoxin-like protein [Candidatus Thermoplasmatota archaeon]|nr:TM0996/MTH895 family glutaredoxin-like protein [Candidatus Thermoplasmatota archaeon]MCG2825325.1 thioredoxin family protein [Thermoplasmatales archaeon]
MEIKILGVGCAKCMALEKRVKEAVEETGINAEVKKVIDIGEIMNYGVMMTPALVINNEIKSTGRIPTMEEIKGMLNDLNPEVKKMSEGEYLQEDRTWMKKQKN